MSGSIGSMQVMHLQCRCQFGFSPVLDRHQNLPSPLTGIPHVSRRHVNPRTETGTSLIGRITIRSLAQIIEGATGVVRVASLVPDSLVDRLLAAVRPADGSLFPGQTLALHPMPSS